MKADHVLILPGWQGSGPQHWQSPWQPLPFKSTLVASRNDPYCSFERAQTFAQAWGSGLVDAGALGHINADSGLGAWPHGLVWLNQLINTSPGDCHGH